MTCFSRSVCLIFSRLKPAELLFTYCILFVSSSVSSIFSSLEPTNLLCMHFLASSVSYIVSCFKPADLLRMQCFLQVLSFVFSVQNQLTRYAYAVCLINFLPLCLLNPQRNYAYTLASSVSSIFIFLVYKTPQTNYAYTVPRKVFLFNIFLPVHLIVSHTLLCKLRVCLQVSVCRAFV